MFKNQARERCLWKERDLSNIGRKTARYSSTGSWVQSVDVTIKKALVLVDDFLASFRVTTWWSGAWEELVAQVDGIGKRHSNK